MNEFNPFETLGIDPNESMPSRTPLETEQVNPMETAGQFNPFKELNINPDGTSVTSSKDTEVSSMLGIDQFTPMTDDEKQSYVDALSDDDWNTWNNLKAEGYSFEARKALMENQDMLYDISTPGTGKYLQTQQKEPITSTGAQRYIDIYQDRVAGFGDRFEDRVMNKVLYKNNGEERSSKLVKGVGGFAGMVLSKGAQLIDDMLNLDAHWLAMMNNLRVIQGKQDVSTLAEMDKTKESYKSLDKTGTEMVAKSVGLGVDLAYWVPALILNTLAQGNGPIAKLINGVSDVVTGIADFTVDTVADMMMQDPKIQEYLNDPANEGMLDDFKEGLSYVGMMIMGKYLKKGGKAIGKSRAGMMMNQFRNRFSSSLKSGIQRGKAGGEFAKSFNEQEGISDTDIGRSNVRKATIEGFKQGWNEKRNETPTEETVTPENGLPDKRITPYEGKEELSTDTKTETIKKQEPIANTQLTKLAEDTKLSEQNINNLKTNPDLQTAFTDTIKPYLEENGKNNPEGVITNPVNDLVYDIKAGIDELKTQQANPNRSINNQKLSPMEKALIKEIEKIINQKEPKQIIKSLGKLTPAQQGLMKRVIPNLDSRIQTINQILELTKEITKGNILSKFLKFQAERPRRGITGFAKQMLYNFVKDIYDQKGIQASTEAIDKFIEGLSDEQIEDITEALYKKQVGGKYDDDLLSKMELELYKTKTEKIHEKGYMPETDRPVLNERGQDLEIDENNKLGIRRVTESLKENLNRKIPGRNETIGEFFKRKGLEITVYNDLSNLIQSMGQGAQAFFAPYYDRFGTLARTAQADVLLHEYGHRVFCQLGTFEYMKILQQIAKRDHLSEKAAEERFAEYVRNYFVYGTMDGELQDAFSINNRKEMAVMKTLEDVMKKERQKIWDVFNISKDDAEISDLLYQIKMDTPKMQEITKRQPQYIFNDRGKHSTGLKSKRVKWLQENFDPNIKYFKYDAKDNVALEYKNGTQKTRTEFLDGLTEEQKSMIDTYQATPEELKLKEQGFENEGRFNYETVSNETSTQTINIQKFLERHPEFNKSEFYLEDLDLSEIKKVTNELKDIHINENGYVVGDFHSHETPVYDYIEDSNLPQELKDFLKKQEIKYLEEQDKAILNRLNNLNGD